MYRDTDGPCLVSDRSCDGLSDPPCRICRELVALCVVELLDSLDKSEISLLDKIEEGQTSVEVSASDADYESQVGFAELLLGFFISLLDPDGKLALFFCSKQRDLADLLEIHPYRIIGRDVFSCVGDFDLS